MSDPSESKRSLSLPVGSPRYHRIWNLRQLAGMMKWSRVSPQWWFLYENDDPALD